MERTLVLVKPDGVQRGLIGNVITRFEQRGLRLVGMKFIQMSKELAGEHYAEHKERPFYNDLISYIPSGPVVAMVWEGTNGIAVVRSMMGATRPDESAPGTIRGDFGLDVGRNIVHGSAKPDDTVREVSLFFTDSELVDWKRSIDPWVFE